MNNKAVMPKITNKPPEPREKRGTVLRLSEGTKSTNILISGFCETIKFFCLFKKKKKMAHGI